MRRGENLKVITVNLAAIEMATNDVRHEAMELFVGVNCFGDPTGCCGDLETMQILPKKEQHTKGCTWIQEASPCTCDYFKRAELEKKYMPVLFIKVPKKEGH